MSNLNLIVTEEQRVIARCPQSVVIPIYGEELFIYGIEAPSAIRDRLEILSLNVGQQCVLKSAYSGKSLLLDEVNRHLARRPLFVRRDVQASIYYQYLSDEEAFVQFSVRVRVRHYLDQSLVPRVEKIRDEVFAEVRALAARVDEINVSAALDDFRDQAAELRDRVEAQEERFARLEAKLGKVL